MMIPVSEPTSRLLYYDDVIVNDSRFSWLCLLFVEEGALHRIMVFFLRSSLLASLLVAAAICLIASRSDALIAVSSRVQGKGLLSTCKSKSTPFVYEEGIDRSTTTDFLSQIDVTVERVLDKYGSSESILDLPPQEREVLRVAHNLKERLHTLRKNNDCPTCWLQRGNCFCERCPPVESPGPSSLNRLFLLMHHKEIGMAVDTAKLILSSYPNTCRLVVAGIGSEYQESMAEMEAALKQRKCLVLFPDETARTFQDIRNGTLSSQADGEDGKGWDVIVIDGTWPQARRMKKRYLPSDEDGYPLKVKLSEEALAILEHDPIDGEPNAGHQLRKHSVQWKRVGTFEATRLFLADLLAQDDNDTGVAPWIRMESYQQIANSAAKAQSGKCRVPSSEEQ
jgi:DTW domain-containing protein YfiP